MRENRNQDSLRMLYAHARPDREAIDRRREAMDPDLLPGKVHAVQLELLKELDRVCRTHGLRYMAIHGTLLGAVRHRGFIPWDDDVDVAMPRSDYDRLLALGKEGFADGYFLQTPMNDYGCFYGGYSKLRRDGTLVLETRNRGKRCHQGIWIDILPLDGCPGKEKKRQRLQKRLGVLQRIVFAKAYAPAQYVPMDVPGSRVSLYYFLAGCTRRRKLLRRMDTLCRRQGTGPLRSILACYYDGRENKNVWSARAVESVAEMPFEDMLLPVPAGWEEILRARYGDDYMTLPPPEKRYRHSDVVFYPQGR